jgi:hypothetical protein
MHMEIFLFDGKTEEKFLKPLNLYFLLFYFDCRTNPPRRSDERQKSSVNILLNMFSVLTFNLHFRDSTIKQMDVFLPETMKK